MRDSAFLPDTPFSFAQATVRALLVLLLGTLWFSTLGSRQLIEPDEGRYAEIPREMLVTGDWVTPRLDGIKYFEKPPLQYWATAVAYRVFGQNEFAARLWNGLTGFLGIIMLAFFGQQLFSRRTGLMAASILASSLLYMAMGHFNTLDMSLAFFLEMALFSALLAQHSPLRSDAERNWMWLAWAMTALAFLTKGLIALILPTLTLLAYTCITRERSAWKRLHVLTGLPLFLLISLPWLIAVSIKNPEFLKFFFFHEQFQRFLTTIHHRDEPWWFFIPMLVLGAMPWTGLFLASFKSSWHADQSTGFQTRRFLWCWIAVVMVFFSCSHSKLVPYIVPMFPVVALLTADAITRMRARALRRHCYAVAGLLAVIAITVAFLPGEIAGKKSVDLIIHLRPWVVCTFAVMALSAVMAARSMNETNNRLPILIMGFGTLIGMSSLVYGSDGLSDTRSDQALAAQLLSSIKPETTLYSIEQYPQTLPFYLQRNLKLVAFRGELDFGLTQEPDLALPDIDTFISAWSRDKHPIAILRPGLYEQLKLQGLKMDILAGHADLVAVGRP